jgi:hypothetical protein
MLWTPLWTAACGHEMHLGEIFSASPLPSHRLACAQDERPFVACRKVMMDMGAPYNQHELVSFHTISKVGFQGLPFVLLLALEASCSGCGAPSCTRELWESAGCAEA